MFRAGARLRYIKERMRPQVGQIINNKYRLLRLLGEGGMGSVYEAHHERLGAKVALKFLHSELAKRSGLVSRFEQEAQVVAKIASPHVVRVIDVDRTAEGLPFIVMDYLEGTTLQTRYEELYRAGQRLSYPEALDFAMQMIEGVEAAHNAGIIHRDLKPDNVIITAGPKGAPLLKLLDFGIAKLKLAGQLEKGLTRPGVVMGTPEYMAPEQAYSADAVDARADIFSLAVIIFEMLAGRRPVGGDEPHQIATAYLSGQVAKLADLVPGIAPDLAAAVHHAMAPLPKDRYASASELRAAIEPFANAVRPVAQSFPGPQTPTPAVVMNAAGTAAAAPQQPQMRGDAVPKTWPPDDAGHVPTPYGGLSANDGAGFRAGVPQTTTNAPLQSQAGMGATPNPGATSFAGPIGLPHGATRGPSTDVGAAMGGSRTNVRAGGTALGGHFDAPTATAAAMGGGYGSTAPMDPYASAAQLPRMGQTPYGGTPYGGTPYGGTPARSVKEGGKGMSVAAILIVALGATGIVLGGAFAVNRLASRGADSGNVEPLIPPLTPTAVVSSDPPLAQPVLVPTHPSFLPGVIHPQPVHTGPGLPPNVPSGQRPNPNVPPSAQPPNGVPQFQPPVLPSSLPPFVIPTSLPFTLPPFPGLQPPQQQPPAQQPPTNGQPSQPPPNNGQPATPSTSTPPVGRPRLNLPGSH